MTRTLLVPSHLDKIQWASRQILERLKKENWDRDTLFAVRLSVEEALANAIQHGNRQDPAKNVRLQFDLDRQKHQVTITVEDEGKGFKPSADRPSKGYGLILIHQLMDEVRFNAKGNQVKMTKKCELSF
jgi:serine/threonine-protein kinase RsbW